MTVGDPGNLDGLPWTWSFDHVTNDIHMIEIAFVGSKTTGLGLAFDNFSPASAAVSIPAAAYLFGSALGLLGWMKRRTA
jgi:hypothetical protein